MEKQTIERLKLIKDEISNCFMMWDLQIENKQQPVAIQDLDFWSKELHAIIMLFKEKEV